MLNLDGQIAFRGLRARRIHHRSFRRQFELARARLVPAELSADRIDAASSLLLWRRIQSGIPDGSGQKKTLWNAAGELSRRLSHIFLRRDGRRPVYGDTALFQEDPFWRDLILFYEYFHGETGAGLGASHQTGWTALVAKLIEQSGE